MAQAQGCKDHKIPFHPQRCVVGLCSAWGRMEGKKASEWTGGLCCGLKSEWKFAGRMRAERELRQREQLTQRGIDRVRWGRSLR